MSVKGFISYILFPDCACWFCRRDRALGDDHLCSACHERLKFCGEPETPPQLDGLSAAFEYAEPVSLAVHAFKYGKRIHMGEFFAGYMPIPDDWYFSCMVPVPLHPLKQWQRGFNQSEEICRALSKRNGVPVRTDLLRRTRFTKTQTHMDKVERSQNVRGAFAAASAAKGRSILLVDDVTTTHATLIACAEALKQAGARRVYAACACIAYK